MQTIIRYFFYDFDGVMTDNMVYVDEKGKEFVRVNRGDGLAVAEIQKLGIGQVIVSTERNPVVSERAKKLGIPCLQGISDKKTALADYCEVENLSISSVAFVGNDINDSEVMQIASLSICPSDAHSSIQETSDFVLKTKGGCGVIREILDLILENQIKIK